MKNNKINSFALLVFFLISIICFIKRENIINEPVTSNCNSELNLALDNKSVLKQSWQASKKKIAGLSIPTKNGAQLSGKITLYFTEKETIDNSVLKSVELSLNDNQSNELIFLFKEPIKLNLGVRYNVFLMGNSEEESVLKLNANSDHYGCFLNGTDTNQAVEINIKYVKNSKIFWIYIVLTLIFAYSFGLMFFFKKDFADVIGMGIIVIGTIIYFCGIMGVLELGIYILTISAFFLIGFECYYILKNKVDLKSFFSPSILIWLFLFIIIIFHNQNMFRMEWDEFSHWGLAVKDMFYSNSFANYPEANTLFTYYPPFISLIQYSFMYFNNVFSESILFIAYQLTGISFMCILLKNVSFKRFGASIVGTLLVIMTPLLFFPKFYYTIYVDALLGIITAYVLICYFTESLNLFNVIRICLGVSALSLTKETGSVLAGLTVLIICSDIVFKNKKICFNDLKKAILIFASLLAAFASWQIYLTTSISKLIPDLISKGTNVIEPSVDTEVISKVIIPGLSGTGVNLPSIFNVIKGQADPDQYQIINNYINQTLGGATFNIGPVLLSTIDVLLIILLISFIVSVRKWGGSNSTTIYRGVLEISVASIGYLAFLMLPYVFLFRNVNLLSSYGRYVGSYLLATVTVLISLLFIGLTEKEAPAKEYKLGILVLVLAILVPLESFKLQPSDRLSNPDALYGYDEIEETFRGFADKSDKIFFVCNDSNGYSNLVFLNAIAPIHTDYSIQDIHTEGKGTVISIMEWEEMLNNDYQYVFILHADHKFKMQYGELFNDVNLIVDGSIFKVEKKQNNKIMLRHIGNVGVKDYI